MRILLAFLVVLNLLYAGWEYLNPTYTEKKINPIMGDLESLQLLRENKYSPAADELLSADENSLQKDEEDQESEEDNENELVSVEDEKKASPSVVCYTLGPFKDKNILQQLSDSIAEYVSERVVRKRLQSEKHRYWVYIPALPDRKQAKILAQKLRRKNIKDFYIVLRGGAENSISLGHFRDPSHANRRMKKVAEQGFDVEINVIYRSYDLYWLDYQVNTGSGVSGFSIDEYITEGVTQLDRECGTEEGEL